MTRNQLNKFLQLSKACESAKRWIRRNPDLSPKELWKKCQNGNYMHWMCFEIIPDVYQDIGYVYEGSINFIGFGQAKLRRKYVANKIREKIPYKDVHKAMLKYIKRKEYTQ
jgi:hypothetical protein